MNYKSIYIYKYPCKFLRINSPEKKQSEKALNFFVEKWSN